MSLSPTPQYKSPPLEREPLPFRSINERLKTRWNRLLHTLSEKSDAFWMDLAVSAFRLKHYDDALVNLYQALAIEPNNASAYKLKGMILQLQSFESDNPDQLDVQIQAMLEAYDHAVRIDPTQYDSIQRRLRHLYLFQFKRGVNAFIEGGVDATAFHRAAAYFKLAAMIRDTITSDVPHPDTPWSAYLNLALAYLHTGDDEEALEAFEEAVRAGDTATNTVLLLADLYAKYKRYDKSVLLLEQAWDDPDSEHVMLEAHLLNAYFGAGLTERALPVYEAAIAREPNNKTYRYNYGSLLLESEAYDEAAEHLRVAVQLDPGDADAQFNLGAAYFNKAIHLEKGERELFMRAAGPLENAFRLKQVYGEGAYELYPILFALYEATEQPEKAAALAEQMDRDEGLFLKKSAVASPL